METIREVDTAFDELDREIVGIESGEGVEYMEPALVPQPRIYEQTMRVEPPKFARSGFKSVKIGPNDKCPCKSGKKFKKCCNDVDKALGFLTTNCIFCRCTVKSLDKEDYLHHVMTDREELINELNEYNAMRDTLILYEKDKIKIDRIKAETRDELNKRLTVLQKLESYLKEEMKHFNHNDL